MDKDLYSILGVPRTASADEIKSAFRKQAKELHPDRHQGEAKKEMEEKFKELASAYQILSDPQQRQKYDTYGMDAFRAGGSSSYGSYAGFEDIFNSDIFSDISDMFGDFMGFDTGRGKKGKRRRNGGDIRVDVHLTFEEAAFGKKETIEAERMEQCDTCGGDGVKPGSKKNTCSTCGGHGKVRQSQGFFTMVTTCPKCRGEGQVVESYCETCGGEGLKRKKKKIEVTIPQGVSQDSYLKLRGEGHSGINGGGRGDLYVVMQIQEHEFFKREGDEIILEVPVTLSQAVLGDEVEVPTIYGEQTIKIPAGTQSGDTVLLRSKGFPHLNGGGKGDMHCVITVEVPKDANSKLKEAFKSVKLAESDDNYKKVRDFRSKAGKYKKESKNG